MQVIVVLARLDCIPVDGMPEQIRYAMVCAQTKIVAEAWTPGMTTELLNLPERN